MEKVYQQVCQKYEKCMTLFLSVIKTILRSMMLLHEYDRCYMSHIALPAISTSGFTSRHWPQAHLNHCAVLEFVSQIFRLVAL